MDKIPVLLYHDFCSGADKSKDNFAVTWEGFKQQMQYLHLNGFAGVSLEKIMKSEVRSQKSENPVQDTRKKVVLTFDDGDLSNYHFVLPALKEIGFSATFFVTINEIGKPGKMDWTMIYDLVRNGMDVGSHGLTHGFLTAYADYTVLNELLASKQILEKYTRKRVDFLSIPRGFYNKRILNIAKDVGFKAVCISDAGCDDFSKEDLFLLKRFPMRRNYNLRAFKSIAYARPALTIIVYEAMRTFLRKLLGWQWYDRIRKLKYHKE